MVKRAPGLKLIIMVGVAVAVFMGLALGEDYVKGYLRKRGSQASIAGTAADVGKTAQRYNTSLMAAYSQDKPSLLAEVATEHQITQVRLYMTYDQIEKQRKLLPTLKSLSVVRVKRGKKKATVQTDETWENKYIDLKTRREFGQETKSYKVRYNLILSGSDWLVDGLEASND